MMRHRWLWSAGLSLAVLFAGAVLFSRLFLDEQLRRLMERNLNRVLDGYTVSIRELDFHPLGFSLDLFDAGIAQNAYPDPPVARIGRLTASIHWRALLRGRLVADFTFERPKIHLNLEQLREELKAPKGRAWQEALQEIYPLKVNELDIRDGEVTYEEQGPFKPLHFHHVNFHAGNIRNVKSREQTYPSVFRVDGGVFDSGRIVVAGGADFLATPHPAIKAHLELQDMALDYFEPIIRRYHLSLTQGVLSTGGDIEYAPEMTVLDLDHVTIQNVRLDYIHQARTRTAEQAVRKKVARSVKAAAGRPDVLLRVDAVNIRDSTIGFANEAAEPEYRLFLTEANARIEHLSNHGAQGPAVGTLAGKFMGSGDTVVTAQFQPKGKTAEFDVDLRIERTELTTMNDLLKEYGKFDVVGGTFSLYSELEARNGRLNGYLKPLLKDIDVYDPRQERGQSAMGKAGEGFLGALAWILQNRPRGEVGTTVPISGRLGSPEVGTFGAVVGLLDNAFVQALSHGLEKNVPQQDAIQPVPSPPSGSD